MQLTAGAFTQNNIDQITAATSSVDFYVNPQDGDDANSGLSAGSPVASLSALAGVLEPGVTVGLLGVLREEYSTPKINDVTIVGLATVPRQATTSGIANGGGSTWLSPSGGTGILATVNGQGWRFQNLYFNNSAAQPCIQFLRSGTGDPPVDPDGSHGSVLGCKFTGADAGIQGSGGVAFLLIDGNEFYGFSGSGDCAIETVTGAGIGTNLGWTVSNNWFYNNANHVIAPLTNARVFGNNFTVVGSATTCTVALSLTSGASNTVYSNVFNRPLNTSPNATLFVGGTNDVWSQNFGEDGIFYGVPDNA